MNLKIFVTGATGTTGNATVRALLAAGVDVIAAVHSPDKEGSLKELGAELRQISFADVAGMTSAMRGSTALFLVTPVTREMEKLTAGIVGAAKAAGVAHIVKLSGLDVDSEPGFTLGHWHRAAEKVIEASGLSWTFLRPNSFMQNFLGNAGSIKGQGTFDNAYGTASVSFIDARDIGDVAAKVLTTEGHHGKIYNLTGPSGISSHEVDQVFSKATGRTVRSHALSEDQFHDALLGYGMPEPEAAATAELVGLAATGSASWVSADVERLLGRPPRDFAQFVGDFGAVFGEAKELTTLDPNAGSVTLINTYTVAPERAEELLDFLAQATEGTLRHVPGFISANLHLSQDRTHVVNYAQWSSLEAPAAARANPKVAELMRRQLQIAESFDPVPYRLTRTFSGVATR